MVPHPDRVSLGVIALVLAVSIGISLKVDRIEHEDELVQRRFKEPDAEIGCAPEEHSSSDV